MPLITVIVVLVIVGAILWFINTKVTFIEGNIKTIINWVVIIVIILWLLSLFGLLPDLNAIRVGG